jgi:hypothetical protein
MTAMAMNRGRKPLCFLGDARLPLLAGIVFFLLFAALVLNHAFYFTMDADEAFNATIAKNWLAGYGYSSSLGVIFPFDPYISSGPAYTAVQAIPVALWGNDPDVQKPFIAVVHLLLFANVLRLLWPLMRDGWRFPLFVAFTASSYALLDFKFWHRPAGEMLSLLYFVNGALLLADMLATRCIRNALFSGLLLACAVLTKGQALLWMAGLAIAVLLAIGRQWSWGVCRVLAVSALAFLLPVIGWQSYKAGVMAALAQHDPGLYQYALGKDWHFFSTHGSGMYLLWEVESWQDLWRRLSSTPLLAYGKFRDIFHAYGVVAPLLAVLVPLLALAGVWLQRRNRAVLLLLVPQCVFLLWAFLLNNSVYTHQMLPAAWLFVLLLALLLVRWPRWLFVLVVANVALLSQQALRNTEDSCLVTRLAACIHGQPNPVRESLANVLTFLQSQPLPAPMANCGWYFAQDIEFALPGANHIRDCMRLFDEAVTFDRDAFITTNKLPEAFRTARSTENLISIYVNKRKNLFGGSFVAPVQWQKPLDFTFVAGIYMMGASLEQQRNVMSFLDHCKQVLYRDRFYAVQHCRYEDLQAYVAAWGGLPIFTHSWEALYYADFMHTTKDLRKNPLHMRPY